MKIPERGLGGKNVDEAYSRYLEESQKPREKKAPKSGVSTSVDGINLEDYIFMPQHKLYVAKSLSYHNKNWYDSHKALHSEKSRMLTIREFVDFLELLKSGNVLNGLEQKLPGNEALAIYEKITKKEDPVRAEWLDADFKVIDNKLYINYNHRTINGQLKPEDSELL